jgi:polar amino acid transport system permease protein
MSYQWDFSVVWNHRELFGRALLMTFSLAIVSIAVGIVVGLLLALMRRSKVKPLSWLVAIVVDVLRAIPPIVLIVWAYYCLPILTGATLNAFQTVVIALGFYSAAFYSEIFRAGLQSIEHGYIEAAYSVGMTRAQTMRRIAGPLAFQRIFPPLVSQCVLVIKGTALAGYVSVGELLYLGQQISIQTFRPIEMLTAVALMFLAIILPLTALANAIEARFHNKYFRT